MKKISTVLLSFFLAALLLAKSQAGFAQQTYRDFYQIGVKAYENDNFPKFLEATRKADSLRPNHPILLYNLAAGYALTGQPERAFATLNYRILFYASRDFYRDEDFNGLKDDPQFDRLKERIDRYHKLRKTSSLAFEIERDGFHPEGITYNSETSRFLISDIREGKIYSCERDGSNVNEFLDLASSGYWSAMGIQIDPSDPNRLWVSTSALPVFEGYAPYLEGKSAVLLIDLETREILRSFLPEGNHLFGDLIVGSGGRVFVTDSLQPVIYTIEPGSMKLEPFLEHSEWCNLQGLALSGDEETLFVSDYILGIYKTDLNTGSTVPLLPSENAKTRGSDGLYLHSDRLVFLQNGTLPKRLGRIELDAEGDAIPETLAYIDNALPGLDEPTLGTFVENDLYYIANSPWPHYDRENSPNLDDWPVLKVFKLEMD